MVNIGADHVNKLLSMSRAIAANGAGLNASAYGAPYPGSQTTLNIQQPEKEKPSSWPWITGLLLGATGLGVGGGTLYALKDKVGAAVPAITAPAATAPAKPQAFDIKIEQIDGNLKVNQVK